MSKNTPINPGAKWLARCAIATTKEETRGAKARVEEVMQQYSPRGRLTRAQVEELPSQFIAALSGPNLVSAYGMSRGRNTGDSVVAVCVSRGALTAPEEEGWTDGSLNIAAIELRYGRRNLTVWRHLPAAGVLQHAIGRWYERICGEATREIFLRDVRALELWAAPVTLAAKLVVGEGSMDVAVDVLVPCESGAWLCRLIPATLHTAAMDAVEHHRPMLQAWTFVDHGLTSPAQDAMRMKLDAVLEGHLGAAQELALARFTERALQWSEWVEHPLVLAARTMLSPEYRTFP